MSDLSVLLLVLDGAVLQDVVRGIHGYAERPIELEMAQGAAANAVARAREAHPHSALAVLAPTDAEALEAIAAGADEALAFAAVGDRELRVLFDRALARARQRLAHASEQSKAAHAAKLASLGTIVAGVAHEINNPLHALMMDVEVMNRDVGPLLGAVEAMETSRAANRSLAPADVDGILAEVRGGPTPAELRTLLTEMESEVRSVGELVRDLRVYARTDENEAAQVIDVPELLDRVIRIVKPQVRMYGHIERDYAPDLPPLFLPTSRVMQVLTNLLVNAAQAIAELKRDVHRVRVTARTDADFVAISIADTGPGIPPNLLERIFDPFFTTKAAGKGTGLGLAISQSITRELGGDLIAESIHGQGATFIALFPIAKPEDVRAALRAKNEGPKEPRARRPTVLVVEDDARLLRAYPRTLHPVYDVVVASHGQEAIELLDSGSNVDAVIADLAMPEVDGRALYEWLVLHHPVLAHRTIFVTAGAANDEMRAFLETIHNVVLEKPVPREQLFEALEGALKIAS